MTFKLIHTADWQIGKRFGSFPGDKPAVLREERLRVVGRLAEAAQANGATTILVAGDVFDSETVSDEVCRQLLARLKAYPQLDWHLLPGNHDPARAGSVWEAVTAVGVPPNVHVHLRPEPAELAPGVMLFPAPLTAKSTSRDPTQWMDDAATPAGTIRIGLAHGSVQGFGSEGDAEVPIDPARPKSARLAYLALGDWHGTTRISDRVWYSGTPETDSFPDNEPGFALAVEIAGADAVPKVSRVATSHYTWVRRQERIASANDLGALEADIAKLGSDATRHLMTLQLTGDVALAELSAIEERLGALKPQLFHLEADLSGLHAHAGTSDMEVLGGGALASVAERLKAKAEGAGEDAAVAELALRKLFALARRVDAGGRA